tara:strand:+ start:75 stop:470 length:396 start_codon:yes stop_codon:yes gene_type:complete
MEYKIIILFILILLSIINIDDLINSVINCFNKYFDFETRSSRKEFWYWQLFRILMFLSITFIESLGLSGLLFISNFIFIIPEFAVSIRRLHDINKSGWWILLTFTIIGIIPLIYFYCIKGDENNNDYGQPN